MSYAKNEINGSFLMEFYQKRSNISLFKNFPMPWSCSYAC